MVVLYSRQDCPLCEEVETQLLQANVSYKYIDIDEDETLRKKYHVKVPVLINADHKELTWPFDQAELEAFAQ